jgi:nucleoside-diphosphate-sugar epimerase
MKKRVLITGVAGFVGSNLADRLLTEGDYEVTGLDNLAYGVIEQVPEGVKFHKEDIRDSSIVSLFEGSDFVFHFAAKNCISDCQLDPVETADINVRGTVNVFEAAKKACVKKIIYAESSAIYEGSDLLPTPETENKPQSFYSISKFSTMYFAEAYKRFYNLNSTALRYFCVYGPRQDYRRTIPPVFSSFIIKILRSEQPVIFGTGEKRRDFIHVDDINDFHIKCMTDSKTDNDVFNLGSGVNYSINEIYDTIASLLEYKNKPSYKPDLPGEAFANLADISKAKSLGWSPKVDLRTGLKSSIDFIKNEMKKGNI